MKANMGTADRVVRLLLVLAIIVLFASKAVGGWLAIVLGIIGLGLLLSSIVGYCPLYPVCKISTVKKAKP